MPIKFPRFSRRKSVGNSIEGAGYEPANTGSPIRPGFEEDDAQHHSGGVNPYGGYGSQQRYNNNNNNNNNYNYNSNRYVVVLPLNEQEHPIDFIQYVVEQQVARAIPEDTMVRALPID